MPEFQARELASSNVGSQRAGLSANSPTRVGTKQPVISRLESGESKPTLSLLKRVAAALDARCGRDPGRRRQTARPRDSKAARLLNQVAAPLLESSPNPHPYSEAAHKRVAFMLDTEATLEIPHLVRDFKPADADLLAALHRVQHHYGYIPRIAIAVVARQLRLGEAHVYGAVTFYASCAHPAAGDAHRLVQRPGLPAEGQRQRPPRAGGVLGIGMGENTADDKLGLHLAQCNGTCDYAPQVWVNGKVVGPLTAARRSSWCAS